MVTATTMGYHRTRWLAPRIGCALLLLVFALATYAQACCHLGSAASGAHAAHAAKSDSTPGGGALDPCPQLLEACACTLPGASAAPPAEHLSFTDVVASDRTLLPGGRVPVRYRLSSAAPPDPLPVYLRTSRLRI